VAILGVDLERIVLPHFDFAKQPNRKFPIHSMLQPDTAP